MWQSYCEEIQLPITTANRWLISHVNLTSAQMGGGSLRDRNCKKCAKIT